jgi:hypothetical protein
LIFFVAAPCSRRSDLDNEVRCACHVLAGKQFRRTFVGYVEEIGLDDVEAREQHVERREEDSTDRMVPKPGADREVQVAGDCLVPEIGRRRHIVLPVDQLVPLPIVGKEQEVVVGELLPGVRGLAGRLGVHVVAPGHALIVRAAGARRTPHGYPRFFPVFWHGVRRSALILKQCRGTGRARSARIA